VAFEPLTPSFVPLSADEQQQYAKPTASFEPLRPTPSFEPLDTAKPTPSFTPLEEPYSITQKVLAGAARTITPLAGSLIGPAGGAIGGGLGEIIASQVERPGQLPGLAPVVASAALGAIPGGFLSRLGAPATRIGKAALGALEGAGVSVGGTAIDRLAREGKLPTGAEALAAAGAGTVLGGLLGGASHKPPTPALPEALPPGAAVPLPATPSTPVPFGLQLGTPYQGRVAEVAAAKATDVASRETARAARGMIELISPHEFRQLSQMIGDLDPRMLKDTAASLAGLRLNRQGAELLDRMQAAGILRPDDSAPIPIQLAKSMGEAVRVASSAGGMYLRYVQDMGDTLKKLLGEQAKRAWGSGAKDLARDLFDARRVLMTQMWGTQVRNVISAVGTGVLTGMSRLVAGLAGDEASLTAAKGIGRAYLRPRTALKEGDMILNALPEQYDKLYRHGSAAEGPIKNRIQQVAKLANLTLSDYSDTVPVKMAMSAFLPESFKRAGLDAAAFLKNPQAFIAQIDSFGPMSPQKAAFEKATSEAMYNSMQVAFREMPESGIAKSLIGLTRRVPVLSLELPFPRFMASYMNHLSSYGPWGMLKLFAKDNIASIEAGGAPVFKASNPEYVAKTLGKAAVGTGMLSMALSLRTNPNTKGEKSYEVRIPGMERAIDTRPFAPLLSPYLALADMLINVSEGKQAFSGLSTKEIASNLVGMQRIEGLATAATQFINARSETTIGKAIETIEGTLGDVLGSFLIPLRTIKDLSGDTRSVDAKASEMLRLVGPAASNVPYLAKALNLPQSINPATGKPYTERAPAGQIGGVNIPLSAVRQATGVTLVDKTPAEKFLNQLGVDAFKFAPHTPLEEKSPLRRQAQPIAAQVDRRIAELMGPQVDRIVNRFRESPNFAKMARDDPEKARKILDARITDIRETNRKRAETELKRRSRKESLIFQAAQAPGKGPAALLRQRVLERQANRAIYGTAQ
jgi:hypothetical protein